MHFYSLLWQLNAIFYYYYIQSFKKIQTVSSYQKNCKSICAFILLYCDLMCVYTFILEYTKPSALFHAGKKQHPFQVLEQGEAELQ